MATRAAVRLAVALTVIDKVFQQEEKWSTTGAAHVDLDDGILKILVLSELLVSYLRAAEPAPVTRNRF